MTPIEWGLAILAAIAVGMSKGGLNLTATMSVPIMALVMSPVQAAGILLPVYIISDMGGLIAYRRNVNWSVLLTVLPGAAIGILLGWATASMVSDRWVAGLVGVIAGSFALNMLLRRSAGRAGAPSMERGSFWGLLAGFTSFVSHSGSPPWQVYAQPMFLPPVVFAGTTTVLFALINLGKLVPYWALGQLSADNLRVSAVLVPIALVSVWLGVRLVRIMPATVFYRFITWALLLVSVKLLWDAVI